jgi:hypothetical protein
MVGREQEMIHLHDPNIIFRPKSVSFRSFDLLVVFTGHFLFRKENITIQHSSLILLFRSTMKDVEMQSNASGQHTSSKRS